MKDMYQESDLKSNKERTRKEALRTLLCALPFLVIAAAAFIARIEPLCTAACMIAGALLIFLWEMKLSPLTRYGRYLKEIHSGLSRRTAGTLVKIGKDPVYEDGVNFYELIINIYEDMDEEGERRFLLDCAKTVDEGLIGKDVVVTSHGSFILNVEPMAA